MDKVVFLLEKENEDTQTLEDVICLVFMEYYFEAFAQKHPEEKIIDILTKDLAQDVGKSA